MIKLNTKIWGMPLLIFCLFTIFVGIISAITPNFSETKAGFDEVKDSCVGTSIGAAFIVMLWVLLSRYKKSGVQVSKTTTTLVFIFTFAVAVGYVGNLIRLLVK